MQHRMVVVYTEDATVYIRGSSNFMYNLAQLRIRIHWKKSEWGICEENLRVDSSPYYSARPGRRCWLVCCVSMALERVLQLLDLKKKFTDSIQRSKSSCGSLLPDSWHSTNDRSVVKKHSWPSDCV